jgi:hypothetical protein
MNQAQTEFIKNEFYSLSLKAAISRNKIKIYQNNTSDKDKEKFRENLKKLIFKYSENYLQHVPEEKHCKAIVDISSKISDAHSEILINGRFRIGNSQKLLNMFLKYLWCVGLVKLPPHMPIDGIVLNKFKSRFKDEKHKNIKILDMNWTEIDDIEKYKEIIECIKQHQVEDSLAEEELLMWNRK